MAARKPTRPEKRARPPAPRPSRRPDDDPPSGSRDAAGPGGRAPRGRASSTGSPRSSDLGGTRERLVAAAEEAFAAHGLRGARVREIVDRAGVNERMLYHYFGDKDGLYRAVLQRFVTLITERIEEALDAPAAGPGERLAEMLRRYFDVMIAHPDMVRLFLHEALAGWPSQSQMADLQREADERLTSRIFGFFAESERDGAFRDGLDPRMAMLVAGACALTLPVMQPRIQRLFETDLRDPAALAAVRDRMIDTLLHGVVAAPRGKKAPRRRR